MSDDAYLADDDALESEDSTEGEMSFYESGYGSSLTAKEAERLRLQAEVEAFLAAGGRINEIPSSVVADPPRKPQSSYGGQPI